MTQLRLGLSLADRVAAWATANHGAAFWELCDAFPEHNASDIDIAALEAGVIAWVSNGRNADGYKVCAPSWRKDTTQ